MLCLCAVVNDDAGTADIECRVISPSGRVIPSHVLNTERGMKVKYTPEEPGVYYVHTYIGGVEIPGLYSLSFIWGIFMGGAGSQCDSEEFV